jgi:hypothetical protein
MPFFVDRESCRSAIEQELRKDPFLGLPDQLPEVSSLCGRLDKDFTELLSSLRERTSRQKQDFERALDTIQDYFTENLSHIVKAFDQAKKTAEPASLRSLSEMFRSSISILYKVVQNQLKPCLKEVSPESYVLPGYLSEIERVYQNQALDWPELATLIYEKSTSANLQGRSILDANLSGFTEQCCRSRFAPVNIFRKFALRQSLRFKYRVLYVPLRQAFRDYFLSESIAKDRLLVQRWAETAAGLEAKLDDAWQAVRYNLEVASAELDSMAADPASERCELLERIQEIEQIISDALTRGHEMLREISGPYEEFLDFLIARIEHHHATGVETLDADLKLMGSLKSLIYWNLKRLRKLQQRLQTQAGLLVLKELEAIRKLGVKAYYEIEDRLSGLTGWLGLSAEDRESLLALSELPRRESVDAKLGTLPPIYRRLFSDEPLVTREFLVGREEQLSQLREALERWQQGRPASTALIGQVGTGKTSLINCLLSGLDSRIPFTVHDISRRLKTEADVIGMFREWFAIDGGITDVSELVLSLKNLPRQGVVIESCHNLMLRSIGGRRAAETFFYILLSTRDDIFWLVTAREWPWAMLDHQISARLFVTQEIRTRFHTSADLQSAILVRHRCSGYRLLFLAQGVEDRKLRKLLVNHDFGSGQIQELLKKKYFDQLYAITSGNIIAAIFFWLTSLRFDADSNTIEVRPCTFPDLGLIRTLDPVSLYSLAELLNHAHLSDQEHSEIFQLTTTQSRTALDYLSNVRLVERIESERGVLYSINPVLLNPICSTLKTMNVLY